MTNGKTIALTRQTFVGRVMSLIFNMQFRFVIAEMVAHFSVLAWRILWTEESDGLQSIRSQSSKSLQTVMAAMKLKDACSLEGKL